jgi:nicotinate-nucleotide adenylyltransferase
MRIGIYGGAFDPIHYGHLLLAQSCLQQGTLDKIIFVPTGVSPHRNGKTSYRASPEDRFAMVQLAVADCSEFEVSDIEIQKQETSYTVETLRCFRQQFPADELFLMMGGDMFLDLPNWYEPLEIRSLATPMVVRRVGAFFQESPLPHIAVSMPLIDLSSTMIRESVARNASIRFQVPPAVENFIKERKIYSAVDSG